MWELDEQTNPFPGLRAFESDEDHLFFGREDQIDELLTRLRRTRFLSVVGTSGSGKSSLIRSGLIPSLYSGFMAKAGSSWRVAVMRPGSDPIGNLADALSEPDVLGGDPELADMNRALLETTLYRSAMGLVEATRQARLGEGENLLILADQFEELFRFKQNVQIKDSKDSALAFVKLLLEAAHQDEVPIYVVLTMRSDFIGNCTEFPGLAEAINDGQYLVPRMTREERKAAIVGPVAVGGAEITPRLVLRLLNDVGDDPDQLPILQHALMRTWDYWERHHGADEPVDLRHYEATGTMAEALSLHAEEAFRELESAEEQRIAELMFKGLTDTGSDARGVRRPIRLDEICQLTGAEESEVAAVIERFRAPGRSFLMPPSGVPLAGESVIDISHESLMRTWQRLIEWVDEEARSAQIYLQLSKAAALYQEGKAGLFRDPELQIALNWRQKNEPTESWAHRYDVAFERAMLFLKYSEKERELEIAEKERQRQRQLQNARRLMVAFGLVALLILFFGMFSLQQSIKADAAATAAVLAQVEAEQQAEEARHQRLEAEKQRQVAEAKRAEVEKQRQRAEEQKQLAEEERQRAEEQRLKALEQQAKAEKARREAELAEQEAVKQRAAAVTQQKLAESLRQQAEASEAESRRLEMVAVARGLALQTTRLRDDDQIDLAALLSLEAYELYLEHRDGTGQPGDDPAIFLALLNSSRRLGSSELVSFREHADAVRALALAPDGETVYAAGDDGTVRRFDLHRPESSSELVVDLGLDVQVRALAVDPAGELLALGGLGGTLQIRRLSRPGSAPLALPTEAGIQALVFAPRGAGAQAALLASADARGAVILWNADSGEVVRRLGEGGTGGDVHALAFDPSGRRLAAAAGPAGALIWDLDAADGAAGAALGGREARSVTWSHDGERLIVGTSDGPIVMVDPAAGEDGRELVGHESAVTAVSVTGRPDVLASGSLDGSVMLWNLATDDGDVEPIELADNDSWVWTVVLTPGAGHVVSGGADRTVRSWPTRARDLAAPICDRVERNLTREEWDDHLPQLEYRQVCPELPAGQD